jgi:CRP-like cAMP-binding protein
MRLRRRKKGLGTVFDDGAVIVQEGEVGDCMFVVQAGEVEVVRGEDGDEHVLATLHAGDFFGEMAVFEKEVRSATVRAHGEARVLKVDKKTLLRRIKQDPLLAVNLLETLSKRIRKLNADFSRSRSGAS